MYAPLAPRAQHRIRQSLRAALPGVGSARLAEALAAGLGFRTSVSLKTHCASALPGAWADADAEAFAVRLAELGHAVPAAAATAVLTGALEAEKGSRDWNVAGFCRVIRDAVAGDALDIRLTTHGEDAVMRVRPRGHAEHGPAVVLAGGAGIIPAARAVSCDARDEGGPYYAVSVRRESLELPEEITGLRLQFGATSDGPYLTVLFRRLHTNSVADMPLDRLVPDTRHHRQLVEAVDGPGLLLIAGRAGSGKATLSAALASDAAKRAGYEKLSLVPARMVDGRYLPPGRLFLVGEIRDSETARLVLDGVAQGARMIATVHGEDAFRGLEQFMALAARTGTEVDAAAISAVVSQRLVLAPCPRCSLPWRGGGREALMAAGDPRGMARSVDALGEINRGVRVAVRSSGCPDCAGGGRAGWTPVMEVVQPTQQDIDLLRTRGLDVLWQDWTGALMADAAMRGMLDGTIDPRDVAPATKGDGNGTGAPGS